MVLQSNSNAYSEVKRISKLQYLGDNSNANIKALICVRLIRYQAGGSGKTNTVPFGAVCRNTELSCRHNTKEMIAAFE